MANSRLVIDAGPITALINRRDQWHKNATTVVSEHPGPFYTCESVVSEACHLLAKVPDGSRQVIAMIEAGVIRLDFDLSAEVDRVSELMKKYRDVPMSLADACLVRMTELVKESLVFTFDKGFSVFRRNNRQVIETVPGF